MERNQRSLLAARAGFSLQLPGESAPGPVRASTLLALWNHSLMYGAYVPVHRACRIQLSCCRVWYHWSL